MNENNASSKLDQRERRTVICGNLIVEMHPCFVLWQKNVLRTPEVVSSASMLIEQTFIIFSLNEFLEETYELAARTYSFSDHMTGSYMVVPGK